MFPYYLLFNATPPPVTTYTWKKYTITTQQTDVAYSDTLRPAGDYIPQGGSVKVSTTKPTISGASFTALVSPFDQNDGVKYDSDTSRYTYWSTSTATTKNNYFEYWYYDGYASGDILGKSHIIQSSQVKGSYLEDVTSTNPNAYPNDGIQGSYWYVKQV